MPVSAVVIVLCVVAVAIGAFAVADVVIARRDRRRWSDLVDESVSLRAAEAVVRARARLAAVVDAEVPRHAAHQHPSKGALRGGPVASGSSSSFDGNDPERDAAREALLDAQRLWESVRPPRDTAARVGIWSGRGWLRAWQFGPIGFERIVIRADHLVDAECWVLHEYRRFRFGFGLGAETQTIAVFAAGTPSRRLDELLRTLLGGGEAAFRLGFAPRRWWSTRQRSPIAQAATHAVLADRRVRRPPDPATTAAVWAAVREDFGDQVTTRGLPGLQSPLAVAHTAGPSLLVGAWWGSKPKSRVAAASSHVVWRDQR